MNYIRFTRLNPLEHFQNIKWSASENGLGTSILCTHADTNHKSSATHQHIIHWIQSVAWTANQMPFPLPPSTSYLSAKNVLNPKSSMFYFKENSVNFDPCHII